MKKTFPIIASISSISVIAASAAVAFNHNSSILRNRADEIASHTITLTAADVKSAKMGEDTCFYFELFQENSTKSGYGFGTSEGMNYCHGGIEMTSGDNHIFVADGGQYYDDVFFSIAFEFDNVLDYTSATLYGEFYYNEYKTNPVTSLEYGPSDFSSDILYIYEEDLYKAQLDSVVIEYSCLV